jgi:hypothetical protein
LVVTASVDDGNFMQLGDTIIVGGDTEDGWKHYTIPLDKYKDSKYICFSFNGFTNGYSDVIYLDNIVVGNATETSIKNTENNGKLIKNVTYYDISGNKIMIPGKGIYIKSVTYDDGTTNYIKFINK